MFGRKRQAAEPAVMEPIPADVGSGALRYLVENGLPPTPANYALAWHVVTDRRGLVALAADAISMEGRRLLQSDADRIMAAEASRGRKQAADDPAQEAMRHQALRLADLASDAAQESSLFGRELDAGLDALTGGGIELRSLVRAMVERADGAEARLRAASREIERLREEVDASRDDAMRDMLTGLPNRRGALAEMKASANKSGIVAIADVDHFKAINDRHGHGVGDRVLKGVATSLAESMGLHLVARWGGEEFLILMEGVSAAQAATFLSRARGDLAERRFRLRDSDEPLGRVTVSIGAARFAGRDLDTAVDAADQLLYAAKRGGRNAVVTDWAEAMLDA